MDFLIVWIMGFILLGTVLSVVAAAVFLVFPEHVRTGLQSPLVSFAIGALLGAAFLGLLPHALEHESITGAHGITMTVLFGVFVFFILEKFVLWRHCHHDECEAHTPVDHEHNQNVAAARMILIGDGLHNLVDGVLIAAAFFTDIHLGIVTALAVIAHEIPQEVGDFAILLQGGYSRAKAFAYNLLSGLSGLIGGIVAYFSLSLAQQAVPYVLALAAASFIYIAVADLIPSLHKRFDARTSILQIFWIGTGVAVIYFVHRTLH